jgi:cobalt-precorrin 5A hydrolase/precorrin-3B C17-methyltransferase
VIGLVAATANGRRRAAHLAEVWEDAHLYDGKPREALVAAWKECEGIVLFLATGATVRLVAPLLEDKRRDPGVVCVDDAGRFAVALCGGHEGGANALAERVADTLGAAAVVTTASDPRGEARVQDRGRIGSRCGRGGARLGGDRAARLGAALALRAAAGERSAGGPGGLGRTFDRDLR